MMHLFSEKSGDGYKAEVKTEMKNEIPCLIILSDPTSCVEKPTFRACTRKVGNKMLPTRSVTLKKPPDKPGSPKVG